jgi:hypothetical protein
MTWRDKKVLVEHQTNSAEYSIAHVTLEGLNVLTPIFYSEMTILTFLRTFYLY